MTDPELLHFANMVWHGEMTIDRNLVRIIRAALAYFNPNSPMNPDCNPIEQSARQEKLESWYALDGRHNHDHPMHSLYTGLADRYAKEAK